MKLVLLTTPTFFVEEDVIINNLFEEGLDILHLLKPGAEPIFEERLLTLLNDKWRKKIVVHDHFYLKKEYNLKGIHLSDNHPTPPEKYRGTVSRSCHDLSKLPEYKKIYDYVITGPVLYTNNEKSIGLSRQTLQNAAKEGIIDSKVYAFGNISKNNIPEIHDLGFGGIVISGEIWNKFNVLQSYDYQELIKHFKLLRKLSQ